MRVGNRDSGNAAQSLNLGHGIVIDKANAVPQDVPGAILNQKSTLADGELGLRPDAPNSWALLIERIAMSGSQVVQSDPLLALQSDILALIFAYGTAFWRASSRGELRTASHTNIGRQRLAPAEKRRQ